jgi:hypothetical protein
MMHHCNLHFNYKYYYKSWRPLVTPPKKTPRTYRKYESNFKNLNVQQKATKSAKNHQKSALRSIA